ncbi:MAG: carbohydrate ABC transporter permease [Mycoplasmatales bacterium]
MNKFKNLSYSRKRQLYGYLFILPWVLGFLMFYAQTLIRVIINSFQEIKVAQNGIDTTFIAIDNFKNIFTENATFNRVLTESLIETVTNLPFIVIFSLIVAMLLNSKFKGRGIARVIFFLPIILGLDLVLSLSEISDPAQIAGAVSTGANSAAFQADALKQFLFDSSIPDFIVTILTSSVNRIFEIISLSGIQILIFISALQSINPALYEVAKIEGATTYEVFWKVVVPNISPIIFMVSIYTIIDSFYRTKVADEIYNAAFVNGSFGTSSAMSVAYLICAFIILLVVSLIARKLVKYND